MQKRFIYAFWIVVLILASFIAHLYLQNKNKQALTPESSVTLNGAVVSIKAYNHHYQSYGKINDETVIFLVDTGATSVSIPEHIANSIGLKKGYALQASTANGITTVYYTLIPKLQIGNIVLHNVRGNINPSMKGDSILLGMSALRRLEITQKNNVLTLKQQK
ncbi:retropepsin-like aspartic protease family protein [Fangia hongkongensis]|uniref:retropepsin-like aspartic protease family protein n=2 Tax=Fangia hongkongensis TaxID=270495 RepID=UPI0003808EE4|nr:TIGR02281 family clan AA aspartic protease [Fangia hongkongensis]